MIKHTNNIHSGKPVKSVLILSSGQSTLSKLLPGKAKAIVTDPQDSNSPKDILNYDLAEIEETLNNVTLEDSEDISRKYVCSGATRKVKAGDVYPKDTQCTDSEIIHDPIVTVVDGMKGIVNDIKGSLYQ